MSRFIRAGVVNYNKGPMEFENGSRIVSATTTGNTGRGMSKYPSYYTVMSLHLLIQVLQMNFGLKYPPTLATGGSAIITSTSTQ